MLLFTGLAAFAYAQIPDFTPPTPLFAAVLRDDVPETTRLLKSGANANEGRFIGHTPLLIALAQQRPKLAQVLIANGADVKATDGTGATTLMWAASSETADVDLVNRLINLGVDVNAANKSGDTALIWALRRGYTPVVETLKAHGASDAALIRQSVEKSIALLQKSSVEFIKVSGCTSCHHQSLPQMAYAFAKEKGMNVDAQISQKQAASVVAMFKPYREQMMQGKENIPDPAVSVTYSLLGLAAEKYPADATTEAMAHLVSVQQNKDGSFISFSARPPLESNIISATALSLRSLQLYGKDADNQIELARQWLKNAQPRTMEERAFHLLGLGWAKSPAKDLAAPARELLAKQNADGGWSQLPALESDAYATGQALVALHLAGQITTTDRAWQRGLAFLLRTQRPDGSWLVRTRSVPVQRYKESGFPHGNDQWASAGGTSWAVMALSLSAPKPQQLSQAF
ncbi:MAG: ankyrin repeat domain-containing protein [Bryobacteraceae bacterium]|nr:ankyrin repeat domain-containing protein [Bryobacteraceae bacterium]